MYVELRLVLREIRDDQPHSHRLLPVAGRTTLM